MDGSISIGGSKSSIANAKGIMEGYPKGTKIFMAFFMPAVCGLTAFMISVDFRKVNAWVMPTAISIGILIGCILSYFIILKPMIQESDEERCEHDARENTTWLTSDPDRVTKLRAREGRKLRPAKILGGIYGLALVGSLFYAIIRVVASPTIYTKNGYYKSALKDTSVIVCLAVFGGSILLAIISQAIKNRQNWTLIGAVTVTLVLAIIASFIYVIIRVSSSHWIETANGGYNAALKEPLVVACLIIPGAGTIALIIGGLIHNKRR